MLYILSMAISTYSFPILFPLQYIVVTVMFYVFLALSLFVMSINESKLAPYVLIFYNVIPK